MRILMLENSSAIERVVKLGLGAFPDAELKTCRSETEFAPALVSFDPEIVLVSDGFVESREGGQTPPEQPWTKVIKDLPADRLVMLASTSSSEESLRQQGYAQVLRKPFKISEFREILQPVWLNRDADPGDPADAADPAESVVERQVPDMDEAPVGVRARAENSPLTAPQVTLDLGALDSGVRRPKGARRPQSSLATQRATVPGEAQASVLPPQAEENQMKNLERICARLVEAKITTQLPLFERAAREAVRHESDERFMKVARSIVRSQVEEYLNQTWPAVIKSLTGQIKTAVIQEYAARVGQDLGALRDTLKTDLRASVRGECEEALRSWMGSYSRDILKEVAREELQKILGPE